MCKYTPAIKTPFCGKGDCKWPKQQEPDLETHGENELNGVKEAVEKEKTIKYYEAKQ